MPEKYLICNPRRQFFYPGTNIPLAGGKVFTYEAGTTTKATTYTDHTGLTPNTNPIILDAWGQCDIWLDPTTPVSLAPLPTGPIGPQGPPGIPGPPGATGNAAEFSITVDIPSATVYNGLYDRTLAQPIYLELVPTQGANIITFPVMIAINYHYAAVPYATNAGNFVISWGPPIIPIPVSFYTIANAMLEATEDEVQIFPDQIGNVLLTAYGAIGAADKPLTLSFDQPIDGAAILTAFVQDAGTGYVIGDTGTIDGGDNNATYVIDTVGGGGEVLTFTVTFGGTAYVTTGSNPTTTVTGVGTGLTLNIYSALDVSGTLRVTTFFRKINLILP